MLANILQCLETKDPDAHIYILPIQTVTGGTKIHPDCKAIVAHILDNPGFEYFDAGTVKQTAFILQDYETSIGLYGDIAIKRFCEIATISLHLVMADEQLQLTERGKGLVKHWKSPDLESAKRLVDDIAKDYAKINLAYVRQEKTWEECDRLWTICMKQLNSIKEAFPQMTEKNQIIVYFWNQKDAHETKLFQNAGLTDDDDEPDDDDDEYDDDDEPDDDDDDEPDFYDYPDDDDDEPEDVLGEDGYLYHMPDVIQKVQFLGVKAAQIEQALADLNPSVLYHARQVLITAQNDARPELDSIKEPFNYDTAAMLQNIYFEARKRQREAIRTQYESLGDIPF